MNFLQKKKEGMTLVEVVVYVGIVVVVLFAIISVIIFVMRSMSSLRASRDIRNSAVTSLERISRDIRAAESIGASTVYDTTLGQLELNTGGTPATLLFSVSDGVVELREDGVYVGVSLSTATVTSMTFNHITTTNSEGVRVKITFESIDPGVGTSTAFYTTGILRSTYVAEE